MKRSVHKMKISDYSILAAEQKNNGCQLVWRNEYTISKGFFTNKQMDILLKQAGVQSAGELLGHTIIVIKSGNKRVYNDTQYVCLPKGASFQAEVKITIVEGDGAMTEAKAVWHEKGSYPGLLIYIAGQGKTI